MTQFSAKVQKPYFCPFLGPKSREWKFFQIWDLRRKLANHKTLQFRSFLEKTNDWNLRKSPKTIFLGLFGPFSPFLRKSEFFLKNPALSLLSIYGPLTSCKISKKSNEPIPRKVRYRRTDGYYWPSEVSDTSSFYYRKYTHSKLSTARVY